MRKLYTLMKRAQEKDPEAIMLIFEIFRPKIEKSLYQTNLNNKNDLEQEIYFNLLKIIQNYDLNSLPTYFEYKKSKEKMEG